MLRINGATILVTFSKMAVRIHQIVNPAYRYKIYDVHHKNETRKELAIIENLQL